jgi:murein DD-endopeptidase MepM/ murein hydrolase activator NlpD/ABC-type cobalt transport system substrate-binding protein
MKIFDKISKSVVIIATSIVVVLISTLTVFNLNRPVPVMGYQLSVDGEIWAVVEDYEPLEQMLYEYKSSYLESIDDNAHIKSIEFVEEIEIIEAEAIDGIYQTLDMVEERLYKNIEDPVYYTVERGDSMWAIAVNHGIGISRLIMLNPDIDPERIWPGDQVMLEPPIPRLNVMISLENTVIESVPYFTEYIRDNSLLNRQVVVIEKGVDGEKAVTYDLKTLNGYPHEAIVIDEIELVAPSKAVVRVGTRTTLTRSSSTNFGVVSGRFTSGFGYRTDPISGRRAFHNGIDIAAPAGTPVYAYANGRVITAGWVGMGGNGVVIDHGNGLRTVYYHLSRIDVSVGQSVSVGQRVGGVGTTGYSTGNHLHFGVLLHGTPVNPLNYI